ncbi:MAG: chemotaxis protein CheW [Chlamydiota bacterium]|nr:chemotaxis protein CheW [Chlamydiota bacterium]
MHYLTFTIDNQYHALPLTNIERVIWALAVTPVNESNDKLLGVINLHNEVIPAVNLRKIFHYNDKELEINDQFIITSFENYKVALWVDHVTEIMNISLDKSTLAKDLCFVNNYVSSIFKSNERVIILNDWEKIFNLENLHNSKVAIN